MSEHLPLRSSVGSRSSGNTSQHHLPPQPRTHGNPDPLASVWIRRLHLTPNPSPPPPAQPPPYPSRAYSPPPLRDATPTGVARSAGFGPFRWSPRPPSGAAVGAWDTAAAPGGSGGGPSMLSPFFRFPAPPTPPVADIEEFAPVRPTSGYDSSSSASGGFPGLSSRMLLAGDPHAAWLATRDAGSAYPSHAADMAPVGISHDLHGRQHSMIPQHFARHDPSSSRQHDEPFSYWNMGRFQRNTTSSSISQITVTPGNFVKKRNADSNSFLPLKFRKLNGTM